METTVKKISFVLFIVSSSYPTYEEWKLGIPIQRFKPLVGSYPTYEEWKLPFLRHLLVLSQSSYPTYEEWKLSIPI